jgi:hypothetical protein
MGLLVLREKHMRGILALVAIVVLLLIVGVATGFLNFSGQGGKLPDVQVEGGKLPDVDANVGAVDVGTKNETIEVPTVDVKRADETSDK